MKNPTFEELQPEYRRLWLTTILTDRFQAPALFTAERILAGKERYLQIEEALGVPWYWIGAIHALESGVKWSTHLHNGDPLTARTVHVPKGRPKLGRGPFTWEESALDALVMKGLHKVEEWTIERMLYEAERYNGWGYRKYHREVLSPYLWSGTHWGLKPGKYIADGTWSDSAVSKQTGVVALLHKLAELDESIDFETARQPLTMPDPVASTEPAPGPSTPAPDTYPKADEPRVTKAVRESRTLTGGIMAGLGAVTGFAEESVRTLVEAGQEVAAWTPAQTLLETIGLNLKPIGVTLAVTGLGIVAYRRIRAAREGKTG